MLRKLEHRQVEHEMRHPHAGDAAGQLRRNVTGKGACADAAAQADNEADGRIEVRA